MANMYTRLADFIERNPKKIILAWIIALIISVPIGIHVFTDEGVLSYDMTNMVDDSYESVQGLEILGDDNYFESGGANADVMIVIDHTATTDIDTFLQTLNTKLAEEYGPNHFTAKNMGYMTKEGSSDGVYILAVGVTPDEGETYVLTDEIDTIRSIVSDSNTFGFTTYVTGSSAIAHDTETGAMKDIKRIDPFSILLVLILIGLFFRSLVAATTPPVVIGFAYGITLTVIFGLAQLMDVFYISGTIVLIAMLGAGCDYCIFILARYREERKKGLEHVAALRESVVWAGESITTSGMSVIIGFGSMSLCTFSMISSMGLVLASGIVFALLAALTLIPALIMVLGDRRIFYPTSTEKLEPDGKVMQGWYGKVSRLGERYFTSSANHATKYAVPIVLAAILITVPLGYVAATNDGSYDLIATMPDGEAKDGVDAITEYANGGLIMPSYILLEVSTAAGPLYTMGEFDPAMAGMPGEPIPLMNWTPLGMQYVGVTAAFSHKIMENDDNVEQVVTLFSTKLLAEATYPGMDLHNSVPELIANHPMFSVLPEQQKIQLRLLASVSPETAIGIIDLTMNNMTGTISNDYNGTMYLKLTMMVKDEPMSPVSMESIGKLIDSRDKFMESPAGVMFTDSFVTGSVAATYDISKIVNDEFSIIEILVVVLIFLLLLFVMKSYVTPLRAILTIVMSILWTLGLTFLVFEGWLGVPVSFVMPIVLFVICLGLGMDYDILLTTRIKEYVSKGYSNDDAIKEAIHKSGSVITICGLIMAGAFGTMMLSTSPMLQQIGFALCFAIAVDALIVRTYIVPAVMHLLGKWNWVGPKCLQQEGGFKFTRKNVALIGTLIAAVVLFCLFGAFHESGLAIADASVSALIAAGGSANRLMEVATIGGGILMLLFGYAYSRVHTDNHGYASSALLVLTGVLLALSAMINVEGFNEDILWAISGASACLACLIAAHGHFTQNRPVVAGLLLLFVAVGAAVALGGVTAFSFAALAAGFAGVLVLALAE